MGQRAKLGHRAVTAKAPADPRDLGWPFRVVPGWDGGGAGGGRLLSPLLDHGFP